MAVFSHVRMFSGKTTGKTCSKPVRTLHKSCKCLHWSRTKYTPCNNMRALVGKETVGAGPGV